MPSANIAIKTGRARSTRSGNLRQHKEQEALDLANNPGPADRDQYGGWLSGRKQEATGRFRTEKIGGVWWLIDPEGRLFWSHGIDCVGAASAVTPITDRENWFAELPSFDSPLAIFYGEGNWAPHNYYEGRGNYRTFNFTAANLLRKYGEHSQSDFNRLAHRRLRSWGMNIDRQLVGCGRCFPAENAVHGHIGHRGPAVAGQQRLLGEILRRVRSPVRRGGKKNHFAIAARRRPLVHRLFRR